MLLSTYFHTVYVERTSIEEMFHPIENKPVYKSSQLWWQALPIWESSVLQSSLGWNALTVTYVGDHNFPTNDYDFDDLPVIMLSFSIFISQGQTFFQQNNNYVGQLIMWRRAYAIFTHFRTLEVIFFTSNFLLVHSGLKSLVTWVAVIRSFNVCITIEMR